MKLTQILSVVLILSLIRLISSCCASKEYYSLADVKMIFYNFSTYGLITESDTTKFEDLMLRCNLKSIKVSVNKNLFNSSYARECNEISKKRKQMISKINIYTQFDFDSAHAANSEITEYIKGKDSFSEYKSLDSLINTLNDPYTSDIDMKLLKKPQNKKLSLITKISFFDEARTIEDTSIVINIK